jgi:methionyl-tRNA synthetase
MFPVDYWRFFLMATRPESKDTNFSWDFFLEKINADLNDTFGNFIHRTLTFVNSKFDDLVPQPTKLTAEGDEMVLQTVREKVEAMAEEIEESKLQSAANTLISLSRVGNQYLNEKEPWNLIKTDREKAAGIFYVCVQIVKALAVASAPFIPSSAEQLWQTLNLPGSVQTTLWREAMEPIEAGHRINKSKPLFSKIDADEKKLDEMLAQVRERMATTAKS